MSEWLPFPGLWDPAKEDYFFLMHLEYLGVLYTWSVVQGWENSSQDSKDIKAMWILLIACGTYEEAHPQASRSSNWQIPSRTILVCQMPYPHTHINPMTSSLHTSDGSEYEILQIPS